MRKRTRMMLGTVVITIAMAGLAGPAFGSGNGKGSENGNSPAAGGQPASATTSPGNSGDAPGQAIKADRPGHANKAESSDSAPAPSAPAKRPESAASDKGAGHGPSHSSAHGNSTNTAGSPGLKPTNSTSHNVSAAASSTSTKRYGNGKTAGQIAMQHGASGSTMLYGPGNSQPHKVSRCAHPLHGNGGGIDVHALKARPWQIACDRQPPAAVAGAAAASRRNTESAPVAGAVTTAADPSGSSTSDAKSGPAVERASGSSVVTTLATAGDPGTLPFTGFPLWTAALVALVLAGSGLTLRRQARAGLWRDTSNGS